MSGERCIILSKNIIKCMCLLTIYYDTVLKENTIILCVSTSINIIYFYSVRNRYLFYTWVYFLYSLIDYFYKLSLILERDVYISLGFFLYSLMLLPYFCAVYTYAQWLQNNHITN
jgi:hypothetical protein